MTSTITPEHTRASTPEHPHTPPGWVLIVEDDTKFADVLVRYLSDEGIEAEWVTSALTDLTAQTDESNPS